MTSSRSNRLIASTLGILPFAVLLIGVNVWPQPTHVPMHWSSDLPDRIGTGAGLFAVTLSVAGACAVLVALLAVLSAVMPALWARWLTTLLAGMGATAAATYGAAALGARVSGGAERVHVIWAIVPFVIGLALAVVVYVAYGRERIDRAQIIESVPERSRVVPVSSGTPLVPWATALRSGTMTGTAIFVAVVLTVTTVVSWMSSIWMGLLIGLISVAAVGLTLAWSRVEVRVDEEGLVIRSLLAPITLLRVAATDVVGAQVLDIDPMKWGGIGLRWLPDRTAYVIRGGPGIVVHRVTGRRFAVEITEGEEVAAAGVRALLHSAGHALTTARSS
ncbi:hypothetical protein [Ornithinimicrobium cryptoxanthini]|uniref:DUF1648 domain-containing protein n=1 Tax=Ornithinimicrobium cryptoxanthini TaxID=2934161 RepID=A0ABY4YLB8_9MICO|nr:hypothetical protein [Ornithinimicrobium cryptoxanthini]USQ76947.1 hypothetical protein NF557_03220 [Ornithinimicrobium cryptoxanthini]